MPESAQPAPNTAPATETSAAEGTPATPPPWGDDFDPARAWSLIENLRNDKASQAAKLSAFEQAEQARADAEKSEIQRAIERAERAEKAVADREAADKRRAVISKHGLSDADADFLAGVSDDDLDARAQALAARLGAAQANQPATEAISGKPNVKLTAGHVSNDATEAFDPFKLADLVHSRRY